MAKYMTPDFDVTVYEIKEKITGPLVGGGDGDNFTDEELGYGFGDLGA